MSIVAIGTVAFDSLETPFGKRDLILGGSGMHFATAASYWAPVALAAVVGEDFPANALDFLRRRGVDLSGVRVCKGKTFHWSGRYGFDLNRCETLKTELGVIADFSPEIPPAWKNPAYLFLGNIHPKLQLKVIGEVGRPGKVVLDTMNLWIETEPEELKRAIGRADLVVVNEGEARQMSGQASLVKAVQWIHQRGPQAVVIKQGEYGAVLYYKGEFFSAPGLPVEEVKDPTGAGDSFAGGLVGYLAKRNRFDFDTLKQGVIVGSAMASLNVEEFGCERLKEASPEDLRGRILEFEKLSHFGKIPV